MVKEKRRNHVGNKYELLLDCQNDVTAEEIKEQPVLLFIEEHLLDLDPPAIAAYFGYSYDHFRHVFRIVYNISYVSYIRKRKLYYARKDMLKGVTAKELAWRYGFKTESGFYKAYVKAFGCSPRKDKRKYM